MRRMNSIWIVEEVDRAFTTGEESGKRKLLRRLLSGTNASSRRITLAFKICYSLKFLNPPMVGFFVYLCQ